MSNEKQLETIDLNDLEKTRGGEGEGSNPLGGIGGSVGGSIGGAAGGGPLINRPQRPPCTVCGMG